LQPFEPDAERKRREAPQRLHALAEQWIAPHYDALERLRAAQDGLPRATGERPGVPAPGATPP